MLRAWTDLDRTYMDGGGIAGGSGGTDSRFSLCASLFSSVPHIKCDLAGYLQRELLLSNWGTPLAGCGSKNPATPASRCSQAQRCQGPLLLSWHHLLQQSSWLPRLLGWSLETRGLRCALDAHGVPDSSGRCAPACYSCNKSEGSWTLYGPSPLVVQDGSFALPLNPSPRHWTQPVDVLPQAAVEHLLEVVD